MQTTVTHPANLFLFFINVFLSQQAYRPYSISRIVYKWSVVEYDYPSQEAKYDAIVRGRLIPNNVAVLDADYHGICVFGVLTLIILDCSYLRTM